MSQTAQRREREALGQLWETVKDNFTSRGYVAGSFGSSAGNYAALRVALSSYARAVRRTAREKAKAKP